MSVTENLQELFRLSELLADEDIFENIPTEPAQQQQRYVEFSESDREEFVSLQKKRNTVRSTNTAVKQFELWLNVMRPNEIRAVYDIPPTELDEYLAAYFLGTRQKDGSEYEPDTITNYQRGIDRYLQDSGYGHSIIRDKLFDKSRKSLAAKRVQLKKQGRGNKPNAADSLTEEEEKILVEKEVVGRSTPEALFNAVWVNNTKMLGFRGGQENRQLKWGDIQLKKTAGGLEYLEFSERETKTRWGQAGGPTRPFNPKIFATPDAIDSCPIETYRQFANRRPPAMNTPDSPFYLSINYTPSTEVWFKNNPMGQNKLANVVKTMCSKAGIAGKKTNHSMRKTAITNLLHAGIPPTQVQQLSGHANVQSINNYAVASLEQQNEMSNILCNANKDESAVVPSGNSIAAAKPANQPYQHPHAHNENTYQTQSAATAGIFSGAVIYGGSFTIA